jgi:hypothetical protein
MIGEGADHKKIAIFYVVLIGGCMVGLCIFLRGVCCIGSYRTPEELDPFKIKTDDDYDDYDDDGSADEIANDNGVDQANDHHLGRPCGRA